MQIDWLTVAAQIVNFLILIWLLQRFLYAPITDAMARRERRIAERLADARDARADAEAEARSLRESRESLERKRRETLEAARREAEALREDLEAEIRREIREERRAWLAQLDEERDDLVRALRKRAYGMVLETARRILDDFADADLAGRVAAKFIERLGAIDGEERETLSRAVERGAEGAIVETRFALSSTMRGRMTRAIHEHVAKGIAVEYRTDSDDLLGIRLRLGDHTVEWSPDRHLDRFEARIEEVLDARLAEQARS